MAGNDVMFDEKKQEGGAESKAAETVPVRRRDDVKLPDVIVNNSDSSVIIHDLKRDPQGPGLVLNPDEPGKTKQIYYIKDMFGEKAVRASLGLRRALDQNLVLGIEPGEIIPTQNRTLRHDLEDTIGKVPQRRSNAPGADNSGLKDATLKSRVQEHVSKTNIFDEQLKKVREELKNDVLD